MSPDVACLLSPLVAKGDVGGGKLSLSLHGAQSCRGPFLHGSKSPVLCFMSQWKVVSGRELSKLWTGLSQLLVGSLFWSRALSIRLLMLVASERDVFGLHSMFSRSWLRALVLPH